MFIFGPPTAQDLFVFGLWCTGTVVWMSSMRLGQVASVHKVMLSWRMLIHLNSNYGNWATTAGIERG